VKLTPKQKAFADYYITSLNATDAYLKAGYAVKNNQTACTNGSRLLRNAHIKAYIDQKLAEKDNERIMSQDEVLEFLSDVAKGKITEQVPLVLGREFTVIDKEPSVKDRTRAAELLGKRYALFTEKHQVEAMVENVEYVAEWGNSNARKD
jgi:phage terminase small subunit